VSDLQYKYNMTNIIVAIAENNAIGRQGDLLCHLPDDLKHFKEVTRGHTVVMGERTWFSLPHRPLPGRRNIVLTDTADRTFDGAESAFSIRQVQQMTATDNETFIIGGGMVYKQFMPLADRLYITHIHHTWEDADTFFPAIESFEWQLECEEHHPADGQNPFPFTFAEYRRKI